MMDVEYLRQTLDYDQITGTFVWKHRVDVPKWWNTKYEGKPAGSPDVDGYLIITVNKKAQKAHRLAWLYVTGIPPIGEIDHRDCVRTNNRFSNLRDASDVQNAANASRRSDNTSGAKGVSWHKASGKWYAQSNVSGKRKCLGYFSEQSDALVAYEKSIRSVHGEFAKPCVNYAMLAEVA